MSRPLYMALWAGCWLWSGGCGFETLADSNPDARGNRCTRSAQCPAGSLCVDGLCTSTSSGPRDVGLVVTLDAEDTAAVTQTSISFAPMPVEEWSDVSLAIPEPVDVYGSVRVGDSKLAADLRFTRAAVIPGLRARTVEVTTFIDPSSGQDGEDADYRVRLLQGITYDVLVEPRGEHAAELPPLWITWTPEAGKSHVRLDVNLERSPDEYLTEVVRVTGLPEGIPLRLRAIDPSSGWLASTVHVLQEGPAVDVPLRLISEPADYELRLVPWTESRVTDAMDLTAVPVYPSYAIRLDHLPVGEGGARQLRLPEVPAPTSHSVEIELCGGPHGTGEMQLPVSVRALELELDAMPELRASFTNTAMTSASGGRPRAQVEMNLLPGSYEVLVRPPIESACAATAEVFDAIEAEARVVLAPASLMEGRVYRRDGSSGDPVGVPGAVVQATSVGPDGNRPHRSSQANADEEGYFSLRLDRGLYDLVARAPTGSGFGWQLHHDVSIDVSSCPAGRVSEDQCRLPGREIRIDAPVAMMGQLRYAGRSGSEARDGLAGATVHAYVSTGSGDLQRAIQVGTGTADADGSFRILLSPRVRRGLE